MSATHAPRVAVVGSGVSGLVSAWRLRNEARVTLFEASSHFGGHAHTVDVDRGGVVHGVDVGFLVFNHRTYPGLTRLFGELGVETAESEMSFSVQAGDLEWSGRDLDGVFAQRRNLLRPEFLTMLGDLLRFNRQAGALAARLPDPAHAGGPAAEPSDPVLDEPLGDFLDRHRYGRAFREGYLLPMLGCIWSCPPAQMLRFPLASMLRFLHNHGLIRITGRPVWRTVVGGSRQYVQRIVQSLPDARRDCPVRAVHRLPGGGVDLESAAGRERFDAVVLACHADQALQLLAQPTPGERRVLGAIGWQRNRVVLHADAAMLPRSRRAWAAWNYERAPDGGDRPSPVCLHYLINRLQPLPWAEPVIVSMNPVREPRPDRIHAEFDVAHPVFDAGAMAAQRELPRINGIGGVWLAGAWAGWGFHEDGLRAAEAAVHGIRARLAQPAWPKVA